MSVCLAHVDSDSSTRYGICASYLRQKTVKSLQGKRQCHKMTNADGGGVALWSILNAYA